MASREFESDEHEHEHDEHDYEYDPINYNKFRDDTKCVAIVDLRKKKEEETFPSGVELVSRSHTELLDGIVEIEKPVFGQWVLLKLIGNPKGRDKNVDVRHFALEGFFVS